MLKSKKFLLIALLACFAGVIYAQTDSPYSRYGYGVLRDQAVGPSKGMGGIGYGLRTPRSANPMNPASYSKVDSMTFIFDIGVTYRNGKFSDGLNSENKSGGGLDYITVLVPLSKKMGLSLGVLPFSSVGYKFGNSAEEGSLSYTNSFSGNGGLTQIYAGLGYATPLKGLSVGANASYLFGSLDHTRSIISLPGVSNTSIDQTEFSIKAIKLDFGLQYEIALSKMNRLTLGAAFSPKINSKGDYENRHHTLNSSTGMAVKSDTAIHNGVSAGLPATYGLGFTFNHDDRIIWGADVTYQKWSDVKYTEHMGDALEAKDRFNDRWRFNAGIEYMVNQYERSFFKRVKYRGGVNYSNSYLNAIDRNSKVDGFDEYGATIGFGLPFRNSYDYKTSYININFEYKKLKPKTSTMISEEYLGVSVNFNISELWFFRRKVN